MNFAIIAAGRGERLSREGQPLPKPLVDLDGKPMIGRLIGLLDDAGAESVSVIVNEGMTDVADYISSLRTKAPLILTVKSTAGSMESFSELARSLDRTKPFCLLTVDTVFLPEEFGRFISDFESDTSADGYMAVTTYMADEKPLYVAATPGGDITGFFDRPVPGVSLVSGGIYALRPGALDILDDCTRAGHTRMRDFQRALVAAGMRLKAKVFSKIVDVDHSSDLEEARRMIGNRAWKAPHQN